MIMQSLMNQTEEGQVVCFPSVVKTGDCTFPTLRKRSNGSSARDDGKEFKNKSSSCFNPVVCWCPEATFGTGKTMMEWSSRIKTITSFVEAGEMTHHGHVVVPADKSILAFSDGLEDKMIEYDEGSEVRPPTPSEIAGLTNDSSAEEKIAKYGSVIAANAVVRC
jgi:hypothetical protein